MALVACSIEHIFSEPLFNEVGMIDRNDVQIRLEANDEFV